MSVEPLLDGYQTQRAWREIQSHLPAAYRLGPQDEPFEEWWDWRGHRLHLDRFYNPAATARIILFHGVGTNGRQMSTILGAPLFREGFETVSIDMPGYGMTQVGRGSPFEYGDWVQAASDFIDEELARDKRPIVLFGLSAGGMLAYHVAALSRKVWGVAGMTFLDQRVQQVADETARNKIVSRLGLPLVKLASRVGLGGLRIPMRVASKMRALVNNRDCLQACYSDRTSAGAWVSQRFLSSYATYRPAMEPETFDVCPILLTQPAEDRWTPLHLSKLFLNRVRRQPVQIVLLDGAGHYPIERRGLGQLHDAVATFVRACTPPVTSPPDH